MIGVLLNEDIQRRPTALASSQPTPSPVIFAFNVLEVIPTAALSVVGLCCFL